MHKIKSKFSFDSAHFLPMYEGKCAKLHGHKWVVEVEIAAEKLHEDMVVDFSIIKGRYNDLFDHNCLNHVGPFKDGLSPTAENIAEFIAVDLTEVLAGLPNRAKVSCVRIWETDNNCAEFYPA